MITVSEKYKEFIERTTVEASIVYSDKEQTIYNFDNGYGASVVVLPPITNGLEVAVFSRGNHGWEIDYSTDVTDDVISNISDKSELDEILERIKRLGEDRDGTFAEAFKRF